MQDLLNALLIIGCIAATVLVFMFGGVLLIGLFSIALCYEVGRSLLSEGAKRLRRKREEEE